MDINLADDLAPPAQMRTSEGARADTVPMLTRDPINAGMGSTSAVRTEFVGCVPTLPYMPAPSVLNADLSQRWVCARW